MGDEMGYLNYVFHNQQYFTRRRSFATPQ